MSAKIDDINRLYDTYNRQTQLIQQQIGQLSSLSLELSDDGGDDAKQLEQQLKCLQAKTRRLEQRIAGERSSFIRSALDASRQAGAEEALQISELRAQLSRSEEAHRDAVEQLRQNQAIIEEEEASGDAAAQRLLRSSCAQEGERARLAEENAQLKEEISLLMDQNETYRSGLQRAAPPDDSRANLAQQNRLMQENQALLMRQVEQLEGAVAGKEQALGALGGENGRLAAQIRQLEAQNQQLTARAARAERVLGERSAELHASRRAGSSEDFAALARSYGEIQQENHRLRRCGAAGEQILGLKGEIQAVRGQVAGFLQFQEAAERELQRLLARCGRCERGERSEPSGQCGQCERCVRCVRCERGEGGEKDEQGGRGIPAEKGVQADNGLSGGNSLSDENSPPADKGLPADKIRRWAEEFQAFLSATQTEAE